MFGSILISLTTGMHVYIFLRIATVPLVRRWVPLWLLAALGIVLWGLFVAGRVYGHHASGTFSAILELLGMNWMAMVMLTFICLFAVDVVTAYGLLFSRYAPTLRGCALLAGLALSIAALIQGMRPPVISHHHVELPGLPGQYRGMRLMALSDLHLGALIGRKWMAARVEQIIERRPDAVFLVGDIFEGHGAPESALVDELGRISAPLGVYAVAGNHEFFGGLGALDPMSAAGIRLLRNTWVELLPGLVLAGLDDPGVLYHRRELAAAVSQTLDNRPPGATILLSHTPAAFRFEGERRVQLMISGHTHGGQVWPFGYLVRRRYPLLAGRYDVNGMTVIVCRGTGTWGPRMRLWHPGEILEITLD